MPLTASESFRPRASRSAGWQALPADYAIPAAPPTVAEAQTYCERLARSHYENFSVATWFLPQRLRPHFHSIYAYCRVSDDLGDEVGNPEHSLELLDEWEEELNATYASLATPEAVEREGDGGQATQPMRPETAQPRHPVFVALRETIRACNIPREPFADLLQAFRQDQRVSRYESFDDVLGYCRYSANPVGRLVLYACGYRHGAPASEFLAGRGAGLREGTHLPAARGPAALRRRGRRDCARDGDPSVSRADAF
jgi:phytoene/squalene synthetase